MVISFNQKSAAYWGIIKANPNTSASAIYKRYKGTPYGMRKQDSLSLTKELKVANELVMRNRNSNMRTNRDKYGVVMKDSKGKSLPPETQERLALGAYQAAKRQSIRGKKLYPVKKGVKVRTIRDTIESMYTGAEMDEYYEFSTTPV